MKTTGLIIGKFAPLHKGHQYLIETALKQVDKLIIFIYDWPELTDVPINIRKRWIEKLYPDVQVVEVYDSPKIFGKTPEIMKLHSDCIVNKLKEIGQEYSITHFFSNEFYGEYMGKILNAQSVQIDINKQQYKISATEIRENPEKYKEFLDKIVYEEIK